jgi:MFS family permease
MTQFHPNTYAAFENKEFGFFVLTRLIMTIAFSIQFIVVEWKVYDLTHNTLDLGLIGLAEIIPAFGFSFFSGHIIDKNEKRNSLLLCVFLSLIISLSIGFVLSDSFINNNSKQVILICVYGLIFLFGVVRAFYVPSGFSLFSLILPKKLYTNGITWSSSAWQIGAVIGPGLGGYFYGLMGASNTIFVSTCLIFIGFLLLSKIKIKPILYVASESIVKSLSEGFDFIFKQKAVLSALLLDMFAVLFGGAVALIPVFAKDILHIGPEGAGFLRSAPSIGAILTMFFMAKYPIKKNPGKKLLFFIFGFGLCIIGFGLSKSFWLSFLFLVLSGVFDGVSVVLRSTILQILTPDKLRGRVSAINSMFVGSSNELGAFESGITAKFMGPILATVSGGFITLGVVVFTWFNSPELKKLELKE